MVAIMTITAITSKGEQAMRDCLVGDSKSSFRTIMTRHALKRLLPITKDILSENPLVVQFTIGDSSISHVIDSDFLIRTMRPQIICDDDDIVIEVN